MYRNNEASGEPLSAGYKLRNAIDRIERIDFLISGAGEMHVNRGNASGSYGRQIAAFSMLEDEIINLRHIFYGFYGETLSPPDPQPIE